MLKTNIYEVAGRKVYYLLQRATKTGIDKQFEQEIRQKCDEYIVTGLKYIGTNKSIRSMRLESLQFQENNRYSIYRDDIYTRFVLCNDGPETDHFGRKGKWVPRGCVIYLDRKTGDYMKVFDRYFCRRGEGRFLRDALECGLYDFLCPGISYVILDNSNLIRGYAIRDGRQLTPYEFERYVGGSLRDLICKLTELTGFYFYDMVFHNVIIHDDSLSFIDLESILPVEWFGKGDEFSLRHINDIDVGWAVQKKWRSPRWYRKFLQELTGRKISSAL